MKEFDYIILGGGCAGLSVRDGARISGRLVDIKNISSIHSRVDEPIQLP